MFVEMKIKLANPITQRANKTALKSDTQRLFSCYHLYGGLTDLIFHFVQIYFSHNFGLQKEDERDRVRLFEKQIMGI